jgi:thymidine kinase
METFTNVRVGKLELIIGNMFSGKSSELIRRINREKSINKKILVVNFISDNRYGNNSVATHDNLRVNCLKLAKLNDITENMIQQYDSFFIDEGQFFSDLFDIVLKLVDIHHKHVVVSGLDGDYQRNTFGDIVRLIPVCDTLDKLKAYCCKCNNGVSAHFTKRIAKNKSTSVIDIGGNEKYIPVCRYHYFQ